MSRILLILLMLPIAVSAKDSADFAALKTKIQKEVGNKVEDVRKTPIKGMVEVVMNGTSYYMSEDGRYHFQGDIIDRRTSQNLTKLSIVETIADDETVVFSPKDPKYTLTVFTDVDCGYCQKLHQEVQALNKNGVKVRYMMYPRAGPYSESAKILENVWCAKNRQEALTAAKAGEEIEKKECATPVQRHMMMAQRLGLRGTPFSVTANGTIINGYRPAGELIHMLEQDAHGALAGD